MKTKENNLLNFAIILAILMIVIGCACPNVRESDGDTNSSTGDEQTDGSLKKDSGDFIVEHMGVKNQRYESIDRSIRKNKTLERAADKLNRSLSLPHDIPLRAKDCDGVANAFYNPRDKSITMCYELMEYFYRTFKRAGDSDQKANTRMNQAITFIFLHELGHALIDGYELPITANQEDAADRCSSYICIEELGEDGVKAVVAAAEFFAIQSKAGGQRDAKVMADEHLLNEQRFFNSLCMIYGSDPEKYSGFVINKLLPKARAVRCPNEYKLTASSWSKLLKPWRKD